MDDKDGLFCIKWYSPVGTAWQMGEEIKFFPRPVTSEEALKAFKET